MKTKHILTAMVLPTLLAACTADEIVENNNNNLVAQGRAEVEAVSFAIDGEGSRLAYNDDNLGWDWEDTDKFLLFPADNGDAPYVGTKAKPAYPGQRFKVGSNIVTGYEYEKDADGAYTTKAAVMGEGLYWGYAPSFNKTARGLIGFDLATSQDVEYYKSEAAQAFVTPLYEVNAEIYNNKLPLEMINWYTTAIFPLKNNTKEDLHLKQIVVNADKAFQVKGEIDINAMGAYIMAYDGEEWDAVQNYDDNKNNNLKEGEFIDGFRKLYMTKAGEEGVTSNILLLNLEGEVLEAGETKTYYMLLPATSGKISCDIIVMAEEGYVEIESTSQSNYLKNTQIYHNGQKAAFGWQTVKGENIAKPYVIKSSELNENENDVYYVASYDDLMNLINNVNGTFEAYNVGDWSVDAAMAEAITDSDSEVIFKGNVIVDDANAKEIEFNKVTFRANVTIKEGNKVTFVEDVNDTTNKQWGTVTIEEDAELIVDDCNLGGTIEVEDGAKLTVNKNANAYAYVVNKGEVTLEEQPNVTVYQEGGILNLNKHAKTAAGMIEYSTEYIKFPADVTFKTIVAKGVILNVEGEDVVLDKNTEEGTMATLIVNGDMIMNADLTIKGEMTIEGDTEDVNGDLIVAKGGLLTNNGYAKSDIIVSKGATLNNNGKARDIYNNGLVVAGEDSKSTIVEGTGRVNNTEGGAVTNTANQTVYYTLNNGDVNDIEDVDFVDWNINTLRIEGTLDMEPFGDDADWNKMKSLTTLELANNAKIELAGDVHVSFDAVNLEGNAKISGYRSETSTLTFDKTAVVNMLTVSDDDYNNDEFYTLTIEDVTVGGDNGVTFYAVGMDDDRKVENHVVWNAPRIETEDATLNASVAKDNTIYINGKIATTAYVVGTLEGLKEALEDDAIQNINLHTSVINLDKALTINRSVNISGGTLAGYSVEIAPNAEVKLYGVTFKNAANNKGEASSLYYANGASKVIIENCTFDGFEWDAIQVTDMTADAEVYILNNTFKSPVKETAIVNGSYVHVANTKGKNAKTLKISGNVFGSKRANSSTVKSDYMVKVYGIKTENTIVGENTYKSGYQNNSVMVTSWMGYKQATADALWINKDMYNAMIGENVRLSSIEAELTKSHKEAENL